jgi:homoserine O-succinyltransferase
VPVLLVPNGGSTGKHSASGCLHIGVINNMPDAALKATERQFLSLLGSGPESLEVCVSLFALRGVPRTEAAQLHIAQYYSPIERLWSGELDGLIVTGAEPQATELSDEPYWDDFTRVVEWAKSNTRSTVWSCLAAHAAVQHMDGLRRRRLSDKRFGVFRCQRVSDHGLTAHLPSSIVVPHSRWNDLCEDAVKDCGYTVLTRLTDGGVDAFAKQHESLFVFLQGHPEYESNTLLLEYRREIGRFLRQERSAFPAIPANYFDVDTTSAMTILRERMDSIEFGAPADLTSLFTGVDIENTWVSTARRFYGNWLAHLVERNPGVSTDRMIRNVALPAVSPIGIQGVRRKHAARRR